MKLTLYPLHNSRAFHPHRPQKAFAKYPRLHRTCCAWVCYKVGGGSRERVSPGWLK